MWPFSKRPEPAPPETRSAGNFTAMVMEQRANYITGGGGVAELTATAQSCISLWENGLSLADVTGTALLTRRHLALIGRSLALTGNAVFKIEADRLVPVVDWDVTTKGGEPFAYRVNVSEAGNSYSTTALAGEILHVRAACSPASPWAGTPPLRRAALTAGLLQALEEALSEVFAMAPLGSAIVSFPEAKGTDMEALARGFRGQRGRIMLAESVNVSAAGGPVPNSDWKPASVSPDLSNSTARENLQLAQGAICGVFGVSPALFNGAATGPAVREAQRGLAQWFLQPIGELLAEEASAKLGGPVSVDVLRPLQAFDSGGRARALATIIGALVQAKEGGLDPAAVQSALELVDWKSDSTA